MIFFFLSFFRLSLFSNPWSFKPPDLSSQAPIFSFFFRFFFSLLHPSFFKLLIWQHVISRSLWSMKLIMAFSLSSPFRLRINAHVIQSPLESLQASIPKSLSVLSVSPSAQAPGLRSRRSRLRMVINGAEATYACAQVSPFSEIQSLLSAQPVILHLARNVLGLHMCMTCGVLLGNISNLTPRRIGRRWPRAQS